MWDSKERVLGMGRVFTEFGLAGKSTDIFSTNNKTPFLRMAGIPDLGLREYPGVLQYCLVVVGPILPCRVDD